MCLQTHLTCGFLRLANPSVRCLQDFSKAKDTYVNYLKWREEYRVDAIPKVKAEFICYHTSLDIQIQPSLEIRPPPNPRSLQGSTLAFVWKFFKGFICLELTAGI
ncbi:hypothetical protein D5086_009606 [Populus alba]|uniref:Uncharacterized protein n=1 Tax=Populus alba TaxID=43335 RepID=A0ACC4CK93_POPAL